MAKALDSLESALNSGDTSSAQSLLTDLLSHSPDGGSSSSSSTTSSDAASSTDSTSSSDPGVKITNYLKKIQSAISSGKTSSAESLLSSLKDYLAANAPQQPPGMGTYSTDGNLSSSSSASSSTISLLA